jgi:hypothetical protein
MRLNISNYSIRFDSEGIVYEFCILTINPSYNNLPGVSVEAGVGKTSPAPKMVLKQLCHFIKMNKLIELQKDCDTKVKKRIKNLIK